MPDTCTYDCSAHPTEISAYGDISGIGVTVAFFATAWILVLLLIGYYLVAYNPELDPFREPGKKMPCQYPNTADYTFLYTVRKLPGLQSLQKSPWLQASELESALNKCVIAFADIQVFTGLAVMISGYIALNCGLQSYHWQLVVYLAWLASMTHLAALSFLRNHLANHPGQAIWRITAMFIVLVFLAVAVGLAGHFTWDENGSSGASDFAICYFGKRMDTEAVAFQSMLKTILLLAYGFSIRLAKLSRAFEGGLRRAAARISVFASRSSRHETEDLDPQVHSSFPGRSFYYFAGPFIDSFLAVIALHLSLLTSFLAEACPLPRCSIPPSNPVVAQVYWLTLSALWNTRRYFRTRALGPKEEDEWKFGQVLPVLLVIAPLATILEHFFPFRASANRRQQRRSRIALEMLDQLESGKAQDNVRVGMDHQQIGSIAHRGAFFLAVVVYLEIGFFFVADESPGLKDPFLKISTSLLLFTSLLQAYWIHCTTWIPRLSRSSLTKRTIYWVVFGACLTLTVCDFLRSPTTLNVIGVPESFSFVTKILACDVILTVSHALPILAERHDVAFRGPRRSWVALFCIIVLLTLVVIVAIIPIIFWAHHLALMFNLGVCLGVELAWYCCELLMERMRMASKGSVFLRFVVLLCILFALGVLGYKGLSALDTLAMAGALVISGAIWILVAIIASLFGSQQTAQGDDTTSVA